MNLRELFVSVGTGSLGLFAPRIVAAAELAPVPLGDVTAQLYSYGLKLVGLSVFVMFLLAGLGKIVPALKLDSKTIIQNAIIGLVILVSAYVILNSISPDLVSSTPTN